MGFFKRKEERAEEISFSSGGEGSELLISALGGNTKLTVNTALQVPAVAHCVDMIASAIAALPIKLYRKEANGKVREIADDSRLKILNNVTGGTMNADNMRRMWVRDYLLTGSAYAYIERNVYAKPAALYYIPSDEVFVTKYSDDVIHKQFDYYVRGKRYEPYKLLKILRNSDGYGRGKGIIKENPLIIETMYNLIKFQKNQVLKGGNKKGFLKTAGTVGKTVIQDIKKGWNQLYSNENTENVMLLNGDIDFKEMSSTSVEMQLNENITTNNAEIMKLFGTLDGVLSETTVKNAVMPVIDAIEAALDSDLLLETERDSCYFAFDTRELTRGSIKERYNAYAVALKNNFIQLDEVRELEDLPPLGFNYIKLGLSDVLLDPKTGEIYTPNTNALANLSKQSISETEKPAEVRGNGDNYTKDEHGRFTGSTSAGGGSGTTSGLTKGEKSDTIKLAINLFIKSDPLYIDAFSIEEEPDYEDICSHGSSQLIEVNYNGAYKRMNAKEFAEYLKTKKRKKDNIRLASCSTGRGDNSFAQQLSRELGSGIKVKAPNMDVYYAPDEGVLFVGSSHRNIGKWRIFENGEEIT